METNPFLLTPDLSQEVEITEGGIVPGTYMVRVGAPELKTSPASGATYIKWPLTIFGAEGDLARFNNWKVWKNTPTSGKGVGILKQFYKACTGEDFKGGQFDWSLLVGSEFEAGIVPQKDQNTGENTTYSEVKSMKPINKVQ